MTKKTNKRHVAYWPLKQYFEVRSTWNAAPRGAGPMPNKAILNGIAKKTRPLHIVVVVAAAVCHSVFFLVLFNVFSRHFHFSGQVNSYHKRSYPQRPSEQAVVIGVFRPPPLGTSLHFIAHRVQQPHCSSICIELRRLASRTFGDGICKKKTCVSPYAPASATTNEDHSLPPTHSQACANIKNHTSPTLTSGRKCHGERTFPT